MPAIETEALPGEADLIAMLADIYRAVDWRTQGGKNRLERWAAQIRVASVAGTMGEFVERLCSRLGVGALGPETVAHLETIRPHQAALLELIARETMPVAMRAYVVAKGDRA